MRLRRVQRVHVLHAHALELEEVKVARRNDEVRELLHKYAVVVYDAWGVMIIVVFPCRCCQDSAVLRGVQQPALRDSQRQRHVELARKLAEA